MAAWGLALLALPSFRFGRVDVGILVVRSSACLAVLRPLPDLVVLPTLPSPVADSLPFLFFLMYCLTYFILYFIVFFSSVRCVAALQGTCPYEAFPTRRAIRVPAGLFFLPWHRHYRSMAWCLGSLSLTYSRTMDIVWRGPVSLVPGILRLSGSDVDCRCGIAIPVPWFGLGCFIHLPTTLP